MTTEAKFFTGWVFFCLMFIGCVKQTPYIQQKEASVKPPEAIVRSAASGDRYMEIREVEINGQYYIVASGYQCISIIPKTITKPEKERQ